MAVFHDYREIEHAGKSLKKLSLSDHLMLYTWMDINPMTSLRVPRINRLGMIKFYQQISKKDLVKHRYDFMLEFQIARNNNILNTV